MLGRFKDERIAFRFPGNVKLFSLRVAFLEAKSRNKSNLLVPTSETNKLQSIKLFAKKLSPSLSNMQQLSCIFDELYSKLKSFQKHVKSQLKEAFRDDLHREVVKERKKIFQPMALLRNHGLFTTIIESGKLSLL